MDIDLQLRELAKSNYWQNLYRTSKENLGVHLFQNTYNFTNLQIRFLYWLSVYEKLYEELVTMADDFLTEAVIEDSVRTDAYLIRRRKKNEYEWKKHRAEEKKQKIRKHHPKKHTKGNMVPIEVDLRSE